MSASYALPVSEPQQAGYGKLLDHLLGGGSQLELLDSAHGRRCQAEQYIGQKFDQEYQASIHWFMPHLLTLSCLGQFSAAVGLRSAIHSPLFAGYYLDDSISRIVQKQTAKRVSDSDIVEIGNLVSTRRGSSQLLFVLLTAILHQAKRSWVVCTATTQVQHLLSRLDISMQAICTADKHRLPDGGSSWGSYYDKSPEVVVIDVEDACAKLSENRFAGTVMQIFKHAVNEHAEGFLQANGINQEWRS